MLAPRLVIFTPAKLLGSPSRVAQQASEALTEIERRNVPFVLSTSGTRAQLETLRRKIGHAHPLRKEEADYSFPMDTLRCVSRAPGA